MQKTFFTSRTSKVTTVLLVSVLLSAVFYIFSPLFTDRTFILKYKIEDISDILFSASVVMHILWVSSLIVFKKNKFSISVRSADFFISATLILFLFNYLFAANAGLEYVQRFAQASDVLSFAPDTRTERFLTTLLFLPLLTADIYAALIFRRDRIFSLNSLRLPLTLLSALLYAFSFPSFLYLKGFGFLIFTAFIPLLVVFKISSLHRGIFYGIAFGIIQTMIINYWLATFSLVSLQFVTALYTILFTFFMIFAVYIYKKSKYGWFLFPFAWIVFEWARSSGFSAYPWCLTGSALYRFLPFIQIASVSGIWGISFTVVLINTALTELIYRKITEGRSEKLLPLKNKKAGFVLLTENSIKRTEGSRKESENQEGKEYRKTDIADFIIIKVKENIPALTALLLTSAVLLFGTVEIRKDNRIAEEKKISLSLIQQNADPRKTSYEESFESVKMLTDKARSIQKTDLVVWSETAFVPNIRRWGSLDRDYNSLTRITHRFLDYQKQGNFYLVTGNDDYEIIEKETGEVTRNEYNASVYFSDRGERLDTYRKIKLVPFTEYFPFKKQLPWMYDILIKMDVNLWEPGKTRTVFKHPEFRFSTPICFEDLFPDYVRGFIINGADIIINISNDYWSLTETEGMQHFINSLFRAVENRRYVVRSTASGLTGVIDRKGKILDTVPFYEKHFLNAKIPVNTERRSNLTFYTKHGDWLPFISMIIFASSYIIILLKSLMKKIKPVCYIKEQ